ncbi:hypothetical protein LOTGIDRAFT_132639, partial [Lottia gigantea]
WLDVSGKCYKYFSTPKTWRDARASCQQYSGDLAVPISYTEQLVLGDNNLFIGGSDRNDEGGWEWSDGSPFRYLNWHTGEPNMLGRGQNCMVLTTSNWHYTWDNTDCSVPSPYICKRKRKYVCILTEVG